jgi:hypothetical protein
MHTLRLPICEIYFHISRGRLLAVDEADHSISISHVICHPNHVDKSSHPLSSEKTKGSQRDISILERDTRRQRSQPNGPNDYAFVVTRFWVQRRIEGFNGQMAGSCRSGTTPGSNMHQWKPPPPFSRYRIARVIWRTEQCAARSLAPHGLVICQSLHLGSAQV